MRFSHLALSPDYSRSIPRIPRILCDAGIDGKISAIDVVAAPERLQQLSVENIA